MTDNYLSYETNRGWYATEGPHTIWTRSLWVEKAREYEDGVQEMIDSQVEYEEEHNDAGSSYLCMLCEGHSPAVRDRLKDYLDEQEILTDEESLEHILDWCLGNADAESGHIFSGGSDVNRFVVDSWPIQEHELQMEPNMLDVDSFVFWEMSRAWQAEREFCCRADRYFSDYPTALFYETTDAAWLAVVPKETLEDVLKEFNENRMS